MNKDNLTESSLFVSGNLYGSTYCSSFCPAEAEQSKLSRPE